MVESIAAAGQRFVDAAPGHNRHAAPLSLIRPLAFPAIDGLRFYAAFVVFLHHFVDMTLHGTLKSMPPHSVLGHIRDFLNFWGDGEHGVEFFFIISGFLMGRIVVGDAHFSYAGFIKRRFLRIYPAFFSFQILATALWCLRLGVPFTWTNALGDLLFLQIFPFGIYPYNYVTWSIGVEFLFYLIIPAIVPLNKLIGAFWAIMVIFILSIIFSPRTSSAFPLGLYLFRVHGLFIGAIISTLDNGRLAKYAKKIPLWAAIGLYLGTVVCRSMMSWEMYFSIVLLPCSIVFIKIVFDEDGVLNKIFSLRPVRMLGTISYSFYLSHVIVLFAVLVFIVIPLGLEQSPIARTSLLFVVGLFLTILVAAASYNWIERPYFQSHGKTRPGGL